MFKKAIIYIPGLNDQSFLNKTFNNLFKILWKRFGYEIYIIQPHWQEESVFSSKLKLITDKIDELSNNDYEVYLIGQSAGGSAALNAFTERKSKVKKVINVCGRIKKGDNISPTLEQASRNSPAFKESVLLFENQNQQKLIWHDLYLT